jgi:hypothetical protein
MTDFAFNRQMKLTEPQERMLRKAVREGRTVAGQRTIKTADKLFEYGLARREFHGCVIVIPTAHGIAWVANHPGPDGPGGPAPGTIVAGPFWSGDPTCKGVGVVVKRGRQLWTQVSEGYVPVEVIVGDRASGGYRPKTLEPVDRLAAA